MFRDNSDPYLPNNAYGIPFTRANERERDREIRSRYKLGVAWRKGIRVQRFLLKPVDRISLISKNRAKRKSSLSMIQNQTRRGN